MRFVLLDCREISGRVLTRSVAGVGVVGGSYPLVKTFSSEVFPQAPSPLDAGLCQFIQSQVMFEWTHSRTSLRWTVLVPPQRGISILEWDLDEELGG